MKQQRIKGLQAEIQASIFKTIRPGITCREIYRSAVAQAEKLKLGDAFLNFGNGLKSKLIGPGGQRTTHNLLL